MPTSKEAKEERRRAKEAERQRAEESARTEREASEREVDRFDKTVRSIVLGHRETHPNVDWSSLRLSLRPHPPIKLARACVGEIAGTNISSIFPTGKIVHSKIAEEEDSRENAVRKREHGVREANWKALQDMGTRLKNMECGAMKAVWSELVEMGMVSDVSKDMSFVDEGSGRVTVEITVEGREIVPTEIKSLTSTGKLSTKPMPKGRGQEIYEDYVCSRCLAAASCLFATLPVSDAIVTAVVVPTDGGGRIPIVSAQFTREGFGMLKIDELDPSDALQAFPHIGNVKGSKRGGDLVEIKPLSFTSGDKNGGTKGYEAGLDGIMGEARGLLEKLTKKRGGPSDVSCTTELL